MPDGARSGTARCVDPATLTAYLDDRLGPGEREIVEQHLASCGECYTFLTEVVQADSALAQSEIDDAGRRMAGAAPAVPWHLSRTLAIGLALAASLVIVVGGLGWLTDGATSQTLMARMAAVSDARSVHGRLSGGFNAPDPGAVTRSPGPSAENLALLEAAEEAERAAADDPRPAAFHALGMARLLLDDIDDAIESLDAAVALAPRDAPILSDATAAYLTRWTRSPNRRDLDRALEHSSAAVTADPTLHEAWYNRALALTEAGQRADALAAWSRYLALDTASSWRGRAERERERAADPSRP